MARKKAAAVLKTAPKSKKQLNEKPKEMTSTTSPDPIPNGLSLQESATIKKRPRTSEPELAMRPAKRTKASAELNEPPSQVLDIYVFGTGGYGELGLGHVVRNGKKPKGVFRPRLNDLVDADTVGIVQIAVGGMHCVALSHDHKIFTWGVNDHGALGRDTTRDTQDTPLDEADDSEDDEDDMDLSPKESTPTAIPSDFFSPSTKFTQVVASDSASFALTTTGTVYGWGTFSGGDGVIGFSKANTIAADATKTKDIQRTPMLIPELKKIKLLAAGGNHIQALDHTGNVFTWGCGEQNQLGRRIVHRTRANALVPSQFGLPKRKIKDVACGAFHSFAVDDKGQVYAWGLNNFGQTGIRDGAGEGNAIIETPTLVTGLQPYKVKEIRGGTHHSIACTHDQKVLVWGRCDDSQSGIPTDELPKEDLIFNSQNKPRILAKPTTVPDVSGVSVAAGIDNSLAVNSDGEVYSWGFSANYRTGLGTEETIEEPTQIENTALRGKKIVFAGCGGQFSVLAGLPAKVNGN